MSSVTPDRRARRRNETRTRLVGAATELFSEKGVEATRINEITERADVGFGSFYNHFTDKDEIVEVVLAATTEEHGENVDVITAGLEDPAEVVAVAHRYFIRLAVADPTWGWLVVRLDLSHRVLRSVLGPRAQRDLERGLQRGRFAVPDPGLALMSIGGTLLGAMQVVLDDPGHADADVHHAELVLRMLGVDAESAAEVARRPMPER